MKIRENPTIREMTLEDVAEVHRLGYGVEEFRVDDSNNSFWSIDVLQDWVRSQNDMAFVVDYNGMIGGFTLATYNPTTRKATMENCFVNRNSIFRGCGRVLLKEAESQLRGKGAKYFCAFVEEGNVQSMNLLKKLNYTLGKSYIWFSKD